jgi:stage V sporulation protein S
MNRFFSKLDLRDIKIDPQGSHFPPDEDGYDDPVVTAPVVEEAVVTQAQDVLDHSFSPPTWIETVPERENVETGAVIADTDGAERGDSDIARYGEVLKVSARSRPSAVAGAIAGVVRESGRAEVQAIGAGATNQAVKAVAIARDYLRETGIEAICLPAFIDVTIDNEDRTAIRLVVEPR